jgi:chromosome segregation ATPase
MTDTEEMSQLREQIAQTVAQRDALKLAIENGSTPARNGLRELIEVDARLSALDSRFKHLWDSANPRKTPRH